jgi:hypothetical protein
VAIMSRSKNAWKNTLEYKDKRSKKKGVPS